jgi:hypothetical protein
VQEPECAGLADFPIEGPIREDEIKRLVMNKVMTKVNGERDPKLPGRVQSGHLIAYLNANGPLDDQKVLGARLAASPCTPEEIDKRGRASVHNRNLRSIQLNQCIVHAHTHARGYADSFADVCSYEDDSMILRRGMDPHMYDIACVQRNALACHGLIQRSLSIHTKIPSKFYL